MRCNTNSQPKTEIHQIHNLTYFCFVYDKKIGTDKQVGLCHSLFCFPRSMNFFSHHQTNETNFLIPSFSQGGCFFVPFKVSIPWVSLAETRMLTTAPRSLVEAVQSCQFFVFATGQESVFLNFPPYLCQL